MKSYHQRSHSSKNFDIVASSSNSSNNHTTNQQGDEDTGQKQRRSALRPLSHHHLLEVAPNVQVPFSQNSHTLQVPSFALQAQGAQQLRAGNTVGKQTGQHKASRSFDQQALNRVRTSPDGGAVEDAISVQAILQQQQQQQQQLHQQQGGSGAGLSQLDSQQYLQPSQQAVGINRQLHSHTINYAEVQQELAAAAAIGDTQAAEKKVAALEQQLASKIEILEQMKVFQTDLCITFEKSQEEFNQKIAEKDQRVEQLEALIDQLQQRCSKLDCDNTTLIANKQNLELTLREMGLTGGAGLSAERKTSPLANITQSSTNIISGNQTSVPSVRDSVLTKEMSEQRKFFTEEIDNLARELRQKDHELEHLKALQAHRINISGPLKNQQRPSEDVVTPPTEESRIAREHQKLVECLEDMIVQCAPEGYFNKRPSVKKIWRWIKNIMTEYMQLKQLNARTEESRETITLLKQYFGAHNSEELIASAAALISQHEVLLGIAHAARELTHLPESCSFHDIQRALMRINAATEARN